MLKPCPVCSGPLVAFFSRKIYRCADCKKEFNLDDIEIKHQR